MIGKRGRVPTIVVRDRPWTPYVTDPTLPTIIFSYDHHGPGVTWGPLSPSYIWKRRGTMEVGEDSSNAFADLPKNWLFIGNRPKEEAQ